MLDLSFEEEEIESLSVPARRFPHINVLAAMGCLAVGGRGSRSGGGDGNRGDFKDDVAVTKY